MSIAPWGRSAFAAAIIASLAACSVADYEKPVTDFAGATNNAAEALGVLDAQVTESYTAVLRSVSCPTICLFDSTTATANRLRNAAALSR
jgi:hypothetical protein